MKNYILTLCSILFLATFNTIQSQEDAKIQVLLVGTYHFDNPGMDDHNIEGDDVFAPKRQAEIAEMNQAFAEFQPDKIFIETKMKDEAYFDSLYQDYLDGKFSIEQHQSGRNEFYQVGFKLAKQLGHQKIYSSDANGLWLGGSVREMAQELGMDFYEENFKATGKILKKEMVDMQSRTMMENIRSMNTDESLLWNHNFYIDIACRVVTGKDDGKNIFRYDEEAEEALVVIDENYLGAELTAEWYKRNIKIYSNILHQIEEGDQRIFVYYGQAHIHIIKQLLEDNPKFEVVNTLNYMK